MPSVDADRYESKITLYVIGSWILSALGGLMFGCVFGISGGVTCMDDFLIEFFPEVHERKMHLTEFNYCKYDDQMLQFFTSSLYVAALIASLFASKVCSLLGRQMTVSLASGFFIAGACYCGDARDMLWLIFGRVFFGIGVGFGHEAFFLVVSETMPVQYCSLCTITTFHIFFQLFVTIGIFIANLINYGIAMLHPNGWRISLGLAAIPAMVLFFGSMFIMETPHSLVERGEQGEAKEALRKIRGVEDVDAEFQQIVASVEQGRQPLKKLFKRPRIIGFLFCNIILQVFQQFTGINAIMLYAPVLFHTIGFKLDASLLCSVIIALVHVGATFMSMFKFRFFKVLGMRKLVPLVVIKMLISQAATGAILLIHLKNPGSLDMKGLADVVVIFMCIFVMSFALSWGPMGWLNPNEIFPIETRAAAFAFKMSTNMMLTFIIAQTFLSMMCHMRAYIFFFFYAWILVAGLCVVFVMPETKGIPG